MIIYPGHFHAALSLRNPHPAISNNVHVYTQKGQEIDQFLSIVESFNDRSDNPTAWNFHIYRGKDFLEAAIRERKGDIAILAGKNDIKMEMIYRLHGEGFHVLADKPWLIRHEQIGMLNETLSKPEPIVMDIMTSRYDVTNRIRRELVKDKEVFGDILTPRDGSLSVYIESVHHLFKTVNEKPLIRPPWSFDVDVQGEGIVDVPSHLVDLAHWTLFPGEEIDVKRDIVLKKARSWTTKVPLEMFKRITGHKKFPNSILKNVSDDVLELKCNGEIKYNVKGVPTHVKALWNLETPEGGGDTHYSIIRGTLSDLIIRQQLPEQGFKLELLVRPRAQGSIDDIFTALGRALKMIEDRYPGVTRTIEGNSILVEIPRELRTTHEEHFSEVFKQFIEYVDLGRLPEATAQNILCKYTLLAEAQKLVNVE